MFVIDIRQEREQPVGASLRHDRLYPVVRQRSNAIGSRRQMSRLSEPAFWIGLSTFSSAAARGDVFLGEREKTVAHAVISGIAGQAAATLGLFSKLEGLRHSTHSRRGGSPPQGSQSPVSEAPLCRQSPPVYRSYVRYTTPFFRAPPPGTRIWSAARYIEGGLMCPRFA